MRTSCLILLFHLLALTGLHAQSARQLTGKVTDAESKLPLADVSVSTLGSNINRVTDAAGIFKMTVKGKTILVISHVGYKSATVTAGENDTTVQVMLQRDVESLNDVVVIGYGKQQKKDVTSAISSISGKELKELPVTNINAALQSRIPGMQVVNAGYQPGAGTNVRIRGINTITQGTGPIYVVDGVVVTYDLREINPADVESIDVLKDASAAAIYGSRASEGVVIITTKKANSGKTTVNYDAYFGLQKMIKTYDFVDNITDYVNLRRAGLSDEDPVAWPMGSGLDTLLFNADERRNMAAGRWTDWVGAVTQTAPQTSHTLSISNGFGKNKFYLSGNYLNQDGIIKGSNFVRYSVKANMESEVSAKFKVGVNTNFSHIKNDVVSNETFYNALTISPLMSIYDSTGKPSANIDPSSGNLLFNNPVTLTQSPVHNVDDRFIGNIFGEYKILRNLVFRSSFGLDVYKDQRFEYYPRTTSTGFNKKGIAKVQNFGWRDYLWENTLAYHYSPSKDHDFDFLGGATYQQRRQEWNYEEASGFPTDDLTYKNMGLASSRDVIASDYFNWSVSSLLGRVIYKFKGRYILNATMRRDGSSRFGADNRYGYFPSVSAAWRLIDEPFIGLKTKAIINDAKIRVGYGVVGNQEIPISATYTQMNPAAYPYNGSTQVSGFQLGTSTQGNPALKWESQGQFNAGFDLAALNNRIHVTFDYYNKNIKDLLLNNPLAPSQTFDNKWINVSRMNTHGIDLGVKVTIIRKKNFDWQMDVNWSKFTTKITELLPGVDSLSPYLKVGEAPNSLIVDYVYDGLYQKGDNFSLNPQARPGDVKIKDLDHNGIINQYDRTIVGRTVPKGWGGIWTYVRYKQVSMTVFANYTYGHDIANKAYQDYLYYSSKTATRTLKEGLNYWRPDNTDTDVPRPNQFGRSLRALPSGTSSFMVQKGDFIRVRNITLAYDVPSALLQKAKINSLRFYVQAVEPFLFTKYKGIDPEIGVGQYDTYPRYRTFLFGLQLSF
ncbi:MAG: TonB-dependent receptor [Filimonas sp.]|nr:TonB-dependent receptor [Filimonas sp.]